MPTQIDKHGTIARLSQFASDAGHEAALRVNPMHDEHGAAWLRRECVAVGRLRVDHRHLQHRLGRSHGHMKHVVRAFQLRPTHIQRSHRRKRLIRRAHDQFAKRVRASRHTDNGDCQSDPSSLSL